VIVPLAGARAGRHPVELGLVAPCRGYKLRSTLVASMTSRQAASDDYTVASDRRGGWFLRDGHTRRLQSPASTQGGF